MESPLSAADKLPPTKPAAPGAGRNRTPGFATLRTVAALMLREMSTRYGRSPGGFIWVLLEPMAFIAVLAIGFSLVVRSPSLGNNFMLFYASGFLPFSLYVTLQNVVGASLQFSRPLLLYPVVTWLDAIIARFLLNLLTGVLVSYVILAGILALSETNAPIDIEPIVLAMGLAALLGLGVGTLNALLTGLFPVWGTIWGIVNRPLFLISGVFYTYEDLPRLAQNILYFNPLVHVTGVMREGVYPTYHPQYVSLPFVAAIALVTLAFGLLFLRQFHKDIVNDG